MSDQQSYKSKRTDDGAEGHLGLDKPRPSEVRSASPGKSILVVDDDPSVRFLLRLILESGGYEVTEAQNGVAALIRLKGAMPDLLLTDMMMPMMDGGALIEHLRSQPETAGLCILAVTGNPEAARNADAVLGKPFDRSELIAIVDGLLKKETTQ